MRHCVILACVLAFTGVVAAQVEEVEVKEEVTVTTTETATVGETNLLGRPQWFFEDATPLETGTVDLRLGFRWETASYPANLGDSSDNFVLVPQIVWGAAEDLELSLQVDAWVGDANNVTIFEDGNFDTKLGLVWRFFEQGAAVCETCKGSVLQLPSMALGAAARIPTGCGSEGIDGELRLIMTYEYDNGVRSHFNVYGVSVNTNNWEDTDNGGPALDLPVLSQLQGLFGDDDDLDLDPLHFQYGAVLGADGPLCSDGAVRWVTDVMYRTGYYSSTGMWLGEVGCEWQVNDASKFGLGFQLGLDGAGWTPNAGATLTYAYSIMY
jgi:hypothetical protein